MYASLRVPAFVLTLSIFAASSAAAGAYPQRHDGWSIGFGVGAGALGVNSDVTGPSGRDGGALLNFRAGYPLTRKLSLSYEECAWARSYGGRLTLHDVATFGLALFSDEGFVLRGGLGRGSSTTRASTARGSTTISTSGFGIHAAMGYEFRVARSFAVGPQFDYGGIFYSDRRVDWFGGGLQFNWYFVRHPS